jgi:hypothetical protein
MLDGPGDLSRIKPRKSRRSRKSSHQPLKDSRNFQLALIVVPLIVASVAIALIQTGGLSLLVGIPIALLVFILCLFFQNPECYLRAQWQRVNTRAAAEVAART